MKVQWMERRTGRARKILLSLATVLMGIGAGVFFVRIYFVQELMFFVGLTALAVFIGVNLVVLGFLLQKGVRSILVSIRLRKVPIAVPNELHEEASVVCAA